MKKFYVSLMALLVLGLFTSSLGAQEVTGSMQGTLVDASGAALPGVTVKATSPSSSKQTMTDSAGKFRLPGLLPGIYELTASLEGFATQQVPDIELTLGDILTIDMTMQLSEVSETILVTSEAPIIEITQSATEQSISGELIDKLPRGRNFTSVVTQAAHANSEDDAGGIQIDGSSGSENRFVVDGMDTTNLQTGVSGKRVITDQIQEVQVKSSGYVAEFGGSTGGVISVVTKTGTNDWRGSILAYYESSDTNGDFEDTLRLDPTDPTRAEYVNLDTDDWDEFEPGFTLGGPIMKDRMYFFASYVPSFFERTRTLDYGGDTGVRTFNQAFDDDNASANISGTIGSAMSYKVSANLSDTSRDNLVPGRFVPGDPDPGTAFNNYDIDREQPNRSYSGNYDWLANQNLALSVRAGHFEYDTQDTGVPAEARIGFSTFSAGTPQDLFPDVPAELQRPFGWQNIPTNSGAAFDLFERQTLALDGTYYVSDFGGEHTFKAGAQFADIHNEVLDGYQDTRILIYWGAGRVNLEGVFDPGGEFGHYRVLQIATQGAVDSDNVGLFLQDSWRPTSRLTLNLGVRAEEEKIPSYASDPTIPPTAIAFDYDDKLAPRLGFAYDIKGDGKWKLYGSYGVFYDITKLEMPRGSFGADKWVDHFFALDTLDWLSVTNDPGCRIAPTNSIADVPNCQGRLMFSADRRHPSNDPNDSTIDPNLKPMESNEFTLGVEHQLGRRMSVGFRYVHKELERTIEDVGVVVPGVGEVFFIANPGEGIATDILGPEFPNQPNAVREYDGYEFDFRLRATQNWTINASYLYSELKGNYSGLASSDEFGRNSPNVNRFFDGLPMNFDASGSRNPVFGNLGTDRPHQFKAQVIYRAPFGTSFGVNQYIASGTPVSTEMNVAPGLPFFPFGRGDLGSTDTLTETDLYIEHPFRFGDRYEVSLSLNILNLFDESAEVNRFGDRFRDDLPLSNEEFFAGFDPNQFLTDPNIRQDPRYGQSSDFQNRRQVRFGVAFRF